jgi:tRNA G18 (ribose-2'-O)-methylase SpoU
MSPPRFSLILPNIRSAHNVGAMFRTADGAGVDKIFLTGYTPLPPHPGLVKVSLGAELTLPWEHHKQAGRLIKHLKQLGVTIIGLELTSKSVSIYEWQPRFPVALVVGNEVAGIPPHLQKLCDVIVELPMRGTKNSLNVSVAGGIALYHIGHLISTT